MKTVVHVTKNLCMPLTLLAVMLLTSSLPAKTGTSFGIEKLFFADIHLFSVQEKNTPDTYKLYMKGMGGRNLHRFVPRHMGGL